MLPSRFTLDMIAHRSTDVLVRCHEVAMDWLKVHDDDATMRHLALAYWREIERRGYAKPLYDA